MRLPIFQTRTWRFTSFCLLTLTTWTAYTQLYSSSNSAISQEPIATLESCIPDHIVPNKANLITISCRNHNTIGLPYSTFRLRCKNPTGWIIQVPTGLETSQACGQDEVCEQLNITPGFADAFIFSVRPPIAASQGELTWVLDVMNDRREWQEVATRQHTLRVFPTQEKKQLIIDTDPAMGRYNVNDPDDALAFIQAYSSNNEIKGVTVTWGNLFIRRLAALCFPDNYKPELDMMSPIDVAYANAQEACSWVGKLCATDNPWSFTCPNSRGHYSIVKGADYGAPPSLPDHASEYLVKAVAQAPGVITIIALGNLTNIANAMRRDPSFADNIREIYIVAGLFFLPLPEWNIWFDADAAEYVLKRVRRATLIPFDATMDYKFPASDVELIRERKNCMTRLVVGPIEKWIGCPRAWCDVLCLPTNILCLVACQVLFGSPVGLPQGFYPYDSIGVAIALDNGLITEEQSFPVVVDAGLTLKMAPNVYDGRAACSVVYGYRYAGQDGFRESYIKALSDPTPCEAARPPCPPRNLRISPRAR